MDGNITPRSALKTIRALALHFLKQGSLYAYQTHKKGYQKSQNFYLSLCSRNRKWLLWSVFVDLKKSRAGHCLGWLAGHQSGQKLFMSVPSLAVARSRTRTAGTSLCQCPMTLTGGPEWTRTRAQGHSCHQWEPWTAVINWFSCGTWDIPILTLHTPLLGLNIG